MTNADATAYWTDRLEEHAKATRVRGATLGLWVDGQQHLAATGVLSTATGVPVTTDSLFQIGSITKPWTATMIMQLIDEGKLSLDTTVAQVLPGLRRLGVADTAELVTQPAPAHAHQRAGRRYLHRHRPGRRLRPALRR